MERISTGSNILDDFLEGGYETDTITTIYGPAGSGKTNLVILACVKSALIGKKIIFIDTEGSFSIERLKQLTPRYNEVLENLLFIKPTNIDEQQKIFEEVSKIKNFDLLIIDTMTYLYRLRRVKNSIKEANDSLAEQMSFLLELTRKKNIPVIITNQVYTDFENSQTRMLGGDIIGYASKCILELQSFHKNRRKIILRKHRSIAGEKELYFQILNEGIALI
ncbi:DNA repair and recombination protein RadB [Candidatus Woesearchaeota archaeon CG10_big_fil_rev_8_21_14_0_10_30_7]|nr:MAG: DNA repair and recombination protein RadB [Candidatus Woesearchaeota archaeon CG10_big_fil_rev_8_21_14_0_10_30_7]